MRKTGMVTEHDVVRFINEGKLVTKFTQDDGWWVVERLNELTGQAMRLIGPHTMRSYNIEYAVFEGGFDWLGINYDVCHLMNDNKILLINRDLQIFNVLSL